MFFLSGEIMFKNEYCTSRRKFLSSSTIITTNCLFFNNSFFNIFDSGYQLLEDHPGIYITKSNKNGLRSVNNLRNAVNSGFSKTIWHRIRQKADLDISRKPVLTATLFEGRNTEAAKHNNPDYTVCNEAGQRILQAAIANLITGEDKYRDSALRQMEAMFDPEQWPDWIDISHLHFGHPADLRTGMLSHDVALAYDWLHPSLSDSQKDFILEGLDRRGIQPYLKSIEQKAWWMDEMINWMTCIAGGLGIAGMALGKDHSQSQKLIDISLPLMKKYLKIYGQEGEFNESPAYANATKYPAAYFNAYYYMLGGKQNILSYKPFPQACRWVMYLSNPPGHIAAFGDSHTDASPAVDYFAPVAAAAKDGYLQWFYLNNAKESNNPRQLVWYDPEIKPEDPSGKLPLGKIFPAEGGCLVSRTGWEPDSTPCVVYGKSGREMNHEHNDAGQVCIDGFGERLIVDLGSPSSYPADFFNGNRWKYYNASIMGHNILMFGDREQAADKTKQGQIVNSEFKNSAGGWWKLDLTEFYDNTASVTRTVIHLFPGIIAVYDRAELINSEKISLRWHTINKAAPDSSGNFVVSGSNAVLSGKIVCSNNNVTFLRNEHHYYPPFDKTRLGEPLKQRNESYIEALFTGKSCSFLTLFSVSNKKEAAGKWNKNDSGWEIDTSSGNISVTAGEKVLHVKNSLSGKEWRVNIS